MKKLKLGTRVIVNGVETFISELHADIKRGIYRVRTSNPTYEFCKQDNNTFTTQGVTGGDFVLQEAPKYGNYQVDDRVSYIDLGTVVEVTDTAVVVMFPDYVREFTLEGDYCQYIQGKLMITKQPVLKKLRVKLGEKR